MSHGTYISHIYETLSVMQGPSINRATPVLGFQITKMRETRGRNVIKQVFSKYFGRRLEIDCDWINYK